MSQGAQLVRAFLQGRPELLGDDGAREWRVGRGEAFGDGDDVWLHAVVVAAEHGAQTPEAGHHLVGDQEHIVLGEHLLDGGPIAFGRRHDTAGAENGLTDEGGDAIRPLGQDQFLQLGRAGFEKSSSLCERSSRRK